MTRSELPGAPRRGGMTLLETLLGVSLFLILFAGAWLIFGTGVRGFYRGSGHVSSMQDAMVLLDRIDADLDQVMVPSASAARPVWISEAGDRIRFYVPSEVLPEALGGDPELPFPQVRGVPVDYDLTPVPGARGEFWPTRNGKPIRRLRVRSWSFRLSRGGAGPRGMVWLEMDLDAVGLFGRRSFQLQRRVALPAAAAARRWGTAYAYLDQWIELDPGDGPLWPEEETPDPGTASGSASPGTTRTPSGTSAGAPPASPGTSSLPGPPPSAGRSP